MASTAESLSSQAEQLQSTVSSFKIDQKGEFKSDVLTKSLKTVNPLKVATKPSATARTVKSNGEGSGIRFNVGHLHDGRDDEFEKF
jgi:hypothetical protein